MRLPHALRDLLRTRLSASGHGARAVAEARSLNRLNRVLASLEPLPPPGPWESLDDVATYARACLKACGLSAWEFGWDRAVKRLGCCRVTHRRITLSRYFVEAHLGVEPDRIRDTVLHETAHALAWEQTRHAGHGPAWKACCRALGATPRATVVQCRNFDPRQPRYRLQHRETGEILREYARRPHFRHSLKNMYMRNRPETLGKLELVAVKGEEEKPK